MAQILHFADLHLDRSFAGVGIYSREASVRREELRAALRRIVDMALARGVDALTVGGDLYEHDRVTIDTGRFIAREFERLAPTPVLVAAGNHDPLVSDSLYRRIDWPSNVRIFDSMEWTSFDLNDGVRVWGVGHDGPSVRERLLEDLHVDGSDANVALLHGSDIGSVPERKVAHCPFERADVAASGTRFVLLGHYHGMRLSPSDRPTYGYPGSPEPLGFDETGQHYVLLLDVNGESTKVEALPINQVFYRTEQIVVSDMATSDEVREAIALLAAEGTSDREIVRVTLVGQADTELRIDEHALLSATADLFRYLDIVDETTVAFPIEELAGEATTRGAFVRIMNARIEAADGPEGERLERARLYGLRAFENQEVRRRADHAD